MLHLFKECVVGLFGGADFDGLHHFAGGDDDAADHFGGHGGVSWIVVSRIECNDLERTRHTLVAMLICM